MPRASSLRWSDVVASGCGGQAHRYAGWDPNWFKAFLGVMLLLAVLVNLYVKRLSTTRKVG